jgi:hypothetical protein
LQGAAAGARPEQRAADAVEKRGVGLPARGSGSGSRRGKSRGRGGGRLPQLLLPQPPTQLASTAWARATASARRWSGGPRWRRREQKRRAAPTSRGGQRRPAQGADRRLRARQDLWVGAARRAGAAPGEKERAAGCAQVGRSAAAVGSLARGGQQGCWAAATAGEEKKNYSGSGTMLNGKNPNPRMGLDSVLIDQITGPGPLQETGI